jgi:hypothetical protein
MGDLDEVHGYYDGNVIEAVEKGGKAAHKQCIYVRLTGN